MMKFNHFYSIWTPILLLFTASVVRSCCAGISLGEVGTTSERGGSKSNRGFKEAFYYLNNGEFYSKPTSGSGDVIKIGSQPEAFGSTTENALYTCLEISFNGEKVLMNATKTLLENEPGATHSNGVAERENLLENYFIYVRRQIWRCINEKNEYQQFLRVHNTLMSRRKIKSVEFYDNVEVSLVNSIEGESTVKIEELRYIKKIGKKYVSVKYDGKLEFLLPPLRARLPRYHNQIKQLYPYYRRDDELHDYEEWLKKQREESLRLGLPEVVITIVNVSSHGEQISINAPAKVMTGLMRCLREQGVNDRFPPHFKTDIYVNNVKISERDLSKYFTIEERIVWTCRFEVDSFYRIETEIVSNIGVANLFFNNQTEIQYIYSIGLPGQVTGVRFREVRYFDSSSGRPIKFIHEKINSNDGSPFASEGDYQVTGYSSYNANGKDIDFKLSSKAVFKTYISDDGYDLRIGSRAEDAFEIDVESVLCKKSENYANLNSKGSLLTRVKVKYHEKRGETGSLIHGMLRLNPDTDFMYESQEVWECKETERDQKKRRKNQRNMSPKDKTGKDNSENEENNDRANQSSGFLRVVNKLRILTPAVRYMETFDGVSIIKDGSGLRVSEIKYLDLNNPDKVVSYGGMLVFDKRDNENVKSTYSERIKSIQRTIDNTAAFIGGNSYSPRSLQMRDYDPLNLVPTGESQTKSEMTINFKPSTEGIEITMDITPTLTQSITINEVIECEFLANEKLHPLVKISIKNSRASTSETREERIGMEENDKQSEYFKWVVREVWQCKIPNQVEPIRRIVTEHHLIKDANKFIYDPILSKVWCELVDDKTILKIKDVRYWNPSNQHTIYLKTSISLAEREIKLHSKFWMSGNMPFNGLENLGGGEAVLQDIWLGLTLTEQEGKDKKTVSVKGPEYKYSLKSISYPDSIRTVTFEKGSRMFQIGSKSSSEIPASTQIWCDIENSRDSKLFLDYVPRVIEYIDGEMFLLDIDLLKDAFTIMKKEVWTCSDGQKSITRIATTMCAKDPIHAVRSLGGVEVDSFLFFDSVLSAAVTETIYILDGEIVKYGGTPSSKSPPSKDVAASLCSTQDGDVDFLPDDQPPSKGVSYYLEKVGNCISEKISHWLMSYSTKQNVKKLEKHQKKVAQAAKSGVVESSTKIIIVN